MKEGQREKGVVQGGAAVEGGGGGLRGGRHLKQAEREGEGGGDAAPEGGEHMKIGAGGGEQHLKGDERGFVLEGNKGRREGWGVGWGGQPIRYYS